MNITNVASETDVLSFGNTSLNLNMGILYTQEKSVRLSAKELAVMQLLLHNPEYNHLKEKILIQVWGYEANAVENYVEVYVGFLRKKLRKIDSNLVIVAIRRLGYHLEIKEEQ